MLAIVKQYTGTEGAGYLAGKDWPVKRHSDFDRKFGYSRDCCFPLVPGMSLPILRNTA
jgi:hypothetical protein